MPNEWLLELGHSRLKLARLEPGRHLKDLAVMSLEQFPQWLEQRAPGSGDQFFVAAVTGAELRNRLTRALDQGGWRWCEVTTGSVELPVAASYRQLGVDRWLALQSAWVQLRSSCMVVDCGTATTIDLLDGDGCHSGGWIMPGADAAHAGLLARAPGLDRPRPPSGASVQPALETAGAIEQGLWLQQAGAVKLAFEASVAGGWIERDAVLLLTGGAAKPLQSRLEGSRISPDLVLEGLAMAAVRLNQR